MPLPSLKVEVIVADGEMVTAVQRVLAQMGCAVHRDAVGAAEIKDDELPIRLIFDLSMVARDALVFDDNIITELATNIDDRFFDLVDLLTCLRQANSEPCRWHSPADLTAGRVRSRWGARRGRIYRVYTT